jgi:hypothetical protein
MIRWQEARMVIATENLPMSFLPTLFSLDEAGVCASQVLTAYDQYNPWASQGSHEPGRLQLDA